MRNLTIYRNTLGSQAPPMFQVDLSRVWVWTDLRDIKQAFFADLCERLFRGGVSVERPGDLLRGEPCF